MSIAFSSGAIVYSTIRGDTIAHFVGDFLAAAATCGWTNVAITDGYLFTLTSKQGLKCKVKLWDSTPPFNVPRLSLQFLSLDETMEGYKHLIFMLAGRTFLLHMNECQIFLAEPLDYFGIAVQGGIPFVANAIADLGLCTDEVFSTEDPALALRAFWSCGGQNSSPNFRWGHDSGGSGFAGNWSALYNDTLLNSETTIIDDRNRLRVLPMTIAVNIPLNFLSSLVQRTRHFVLSEAELVGLAFDPLLAWGDNKVVGQIYDAFEPSLDTPLDFEIDNLFGANWVNYMHGPFNGQGTRFGSLMLALGKPLTNTEAYVY